MTGTAIVSDENGETRLRHEELEERWLEGAEVSFFDPRLMYYQGDLGHVA